MKSEIFCEFAELSFTQHRNESSFNISKENMKFKC